LDIGFSFTDAEAILKKGMYPDEISALVDAKIKIENREKIESQIRIADAVHSAFVGAQSKEGLASFLSWARKKENLLIPEVEKPKVKTVFQRRKEQLKGEDVENTSK
jgi:hypothetical protein